MPHDIDSTATPHPGAEPLSPPERMDSVPGRRECVPVAVVLQETRLVNRWVDARWEPLEVLPLASTGPASVVRLPEEAAGVRWRFEGHHIELHRSEGEGYFLNLSAPAPKVFVMWRMLEPEARTEGGPAAAPFIVTVSYNEAARMLDGGEQVDAVPMPDEIRAWMAPFVATHYKPEPKRKVRRRDPLAEDRPRAERGVSHD